MLTRCLAFSMLLAFLIAGCAAAPSPGAPRSQPEKPTAPPAGGEGRGGY